MKSSEAPGLGSATHPWTSTPDAKNRNRKLCEVAEYGDEDRHQPVHIREYFELASRCVE
jgi:hypothetical protein